MSLKSEASALLAQAKAYSARDVILAERFARVREDHRLALDASERMANRNALISLCEKLLERMQRVTDANAALRGEAARRGRTLARLQKILDADMPAAQAIEAVRKALEV